MSILLFHPSVAPFVQHAAAALQDAGQLDRFVTTVRDDPASFTQRALCAAAALGGRDLAARFRRRAVTEVTLEQALTALLLAGRECDVAPEPEYVTLPKLPEALDCRAVMHHYVAESKRWFFQHNWRRVTRAPQGDTCSA